MFRFHRPRATRSRVEGQVENDPGPEISVPYRSWGKHPSLSDSTALTQEDALRIRSSAFKLPVTPSRLALLRARPCGSKVCGISIVRAYHRLLLPHLLDAMAAAGATRESAGRREWRVIECPVRGGSMASIKMKTAGLKAAITRLQREKKELQDIANMRGQQLRDLGATVRSPRFKK